MKSTNRRNKKASLDEKEVLEYIRDNPEIFEKHEEFLTKLNLHFDNNNIASLVKKQLVNLRRKNSDQKIKYDELLYNAELNWDFIIKIQNIADAASKYRSLKKWIAYLSESMASDFDADEVIINVKKKDNNEVFSSVVPKNNEPIMISGTVFKPYYGQLKNFKRKSVILSENIGSIVFYPFKDREWSGFFYLGSADPLRYNSGSDSGLLSLLGSVLKLSITMQIKGSL